jgi:hypothetical protein
LSARQQPSAKTSCFRDLGSQKGCARPRRPWPQPASLLRDGLQHTGRTTTYADSLLIEREPRASGAITIRSLQRGYLLANSSNDINDVIVWTSQPEPRSHDH